MTTANVEAYVRPLAEDSLATFKEVAEAASAQEAEGQYSGANTFATINTWTSTEAISNSRQVADANSESLRILTREPAISRVVVKDENGRPSTYYFCRTTPPRLRKDGRLLASYRSPVGRLAELDIGDDHCLLKGGEEHWVEIVEHAVFTPKIVNDRWDAKNSILKGEDYGPLTIESLRSFLEEEEVVDASALDRLLMEEEASENVRQGIRRSVISKMDLRDQPVLDRYQGEIFRLPINSQLLILGAPGTGKTTTLIRRLGQKLDSAYLDESERRLVQSAAETDHMRSWLMFTPTELLRLYVKEAFNRENIPAPDERIKTWDDFRENLAREAFRILRSAASSSSFVMKADAKTLLSDTEQHQIKWFSDFDGWQKESFWEDFRSSAENLAANQNQEVARLGERILAILNASAGKRGGQIFLRLSEVATEIGSLLEEMKGESDSRIKGALNLQVNRDRTFLDSLAEFVAGLGDLSEDAEDQEAEEEDIASLPKIGRQGALTRYMRAVRAQARSKVRKRVVPKASANAKILEWINDRTLGEDELMEVGQSLIVQGELRAFVNPVRRYVDGILSRYRRYRRTRQSEGQWYRSDGAVPTDIHPLEVDLLLLSMMRASNELIADFGASSNDDTPSSSVFRRMRDLHCNQVVVDEATDFSPLQLGCMAALARPGIDSFFACGDFNQRITSWGARTADEFRWIAPGIEMKTVKVAYRQTRQLHDFAKRLVSISAVDDDLSVLPERVDQDGFSPVLVKGLAELDAVAGWIGERIIEIEDFVGSLPSIAVLVNSEEGVRPVATELATRLANRNIAVEACPDGKVRGRDGTVRVFNVQHIKGLEFEAVFFVNIDELAHQLPDLFDKYLYVGATRAATYLGLTCAGELPSAMSELESIFSETWA